MQWPVKADAAASLAEEWAALISAEIAKTQNVFAEHVAVVVSNTLSCPDSTKALTALRALPQLVNTEVWLQDSPASCRGGCAGDLQLHAQQIVATPSTETVTGDLKKQQCRRVTVAELEHDYDYLDEKCAIPSPPVSDLFSGHSFKHAPAHLARAFDAYRRATRNSVVALLVTAFAAACVAAFTGVRLFTLDDADDTSVYATWWCLSMMAGIACSSIAIPFGMSFARSARVHALRRSAWAERRFEGSV